MRLFDTQSQTYLAFKPPELVRIYTCGITPYDAAHLGHILTFMTYDLLQRRLEDIGHTVHLVRNVTDVDDPIYRRAAELGIPYNELAERETVSFDETLEQLRFRPAFARPRASQYIMQMADAVMKLKSTGFAYQLDDDVYFDVSQDSKFGSFSGFSERLQLGFMQTRGGDPDRPGKRQPLDFLLWHGVKDATDLAAWDTPLGRGRPGWHIECSVMADTLLGTPFDLHGGGTDLLFPHHECEIAQSFGLGKQTLANHWMHVSPMGYLGEKMSKSLGNLVFAKDLLRDYDAATIRLALMHYHYRVGGEWQPELLPAAAQLMSRITTRKAYASIAAAQLLLSEVQSGLDDDINTHRIKHALMDFADSREANAKNNASEAIVEHSLQLLGLV